MTRPHKPPGYTPIASTSQEERAGRVCRCAACERDGEHAPWCSVHREVAPGEREPACDCGLR